MTTIYKYPIRLAQDSQVLIPKGATILTAQLQGSSICLWAIVDTDAPNVLRRISIVGTGWDFERQTLAYIATVQHGAFVWHVFDGGEVAA